VGRNGIAPKLFFTHFTQMVQFAALMNTLVGSAIIGIEEAVSHQAAK
jgi:hypothetical protein